jgi:hypothetical protein
LLSPVSVTACLPAASAKFVIRNGTAEATYSGRIEYAFGRRQPRHAEGNASLTKIKHASGALLHL